jgi:hypothetical protein
MFVMQHYHLPDSPHVLDKGKPNKKQPNRHIVADSRDPAFLNCEADVEKDYFRELQEAYPDTCEEVDVDHG